MDEYEAEIEGTTWEEKGHIPDDMQDTEDDDDESSRDGGCILEGLGASQTVNIE